MLFADQGAGEDIFICDTGINAGHQAFGGRVNMLHGAADDHGHGTHCAGTAAGEVYGIARKATIHSVKVCTYDGLCYQDATIAGESVSVVVVQYIIPLTQRSCGA